MSTLVVTSKELDCAMSGSSVSQLVGGFVGSSATARGNGTSRADLVAVRESRWRTVDPMQNTQNLVVATYARKLAVLTYRTTEHFPRSELFGLSSQMQRAAVSIGSNIAEGCGRSTKKALIHSLDQAFGEASELEFQCLIAADMN